MHDDNEALVRMALDASPCLKCTSASCELARYILGTRGKPSHLKKWRTDRKKQGDKGDGASTRVSPTQGCANDVG